MPEGYFGRKKRGAGPVEIAPRRRLDKQVYAGKGWFDQPVYRASGGRAKPKGFFFGGSSGSSTTYSNTINSVDPGGSYYPLMQGVFHRTQDLMDRPYQPYTGERFQPFSQDQTAGFQGVRDSQGSWKPYTEDASAAYDRAAGVDPTAAAQPYLDKAGSLQTGSQAASPFLSQAGKNWTDVADQYMNPYNEAVTDRIAQLGARNLSENLLPKVNSVFTGAQFGRDRHAQFTENALRDTQESILGQQAQALQQGYNASANIFGNDAARQAGLAGTAGGLANTDINTQAGLGQTAAGTAATGKASDVALGSAQAGLGQTVQGAGYRDANALVSSGALQQAQGQQQKDFDYQQFLEQRQDPYQKLSWAQSVANGWQLPTQSSTLTQSYQQPASGSPFGQILGGALSLGSLAVPGAGGTSALGNLFGGLKGLFAEGGRVPAKERQADDDLALWASQYYASGGQVPVVKAIRQPHMAGGGYFDETVIDETPRSFWDILAARREKPRGIDLEMLKRLLGV